VGLAFRNLKVEGTEWDGHTKMLESMSVLLIPNFSALLFFEIPLLLFSVSIALDDA
jgi:hypothetical protein